MPPMIVAVVMVLQRLEGLLDREVVDRFAFDAWWKYACGGLDFDYPGDYPGLCTRCWWICGLARSARPDRISRSRWRWRGRRAGGAAGAGLHAVV